MFSKGFSHRRHSHTVLLPSTLCKIQPQNMFEFHQGVHPLDGVTPGGLSPPWAVCRPQPPPPPVVTPLKGGSKTTVVFRVKWHFTCKKVCHKVSLCEYSQRQSGKAFTGLSIGAKNGLRGTSPTTWKFAGNSLTSFQTPIFNRFLLVASQP